MSEPAAGSGDEPRVWGPGHPGAPGPVGQPASWGPPAGAPSAFAWPPPGSAPTARPAGVPGLAGGRDDLRAAALTVLGLAASGLVAGLVWWWLAPRAEYRVTADDLVPVGRTPSSELFMADDGVFVVVLAVLGLLAGLVVWSRRRRRGAVLLAALAIGMGAAGVVAWQLGRLLGPMPSEQELSDVGNHVTTSLDLGAAAALVAGPFVAVLVYVVAASLTSADELRRPPNG